MKNDSNEAIKLVNRYVRQVAEEEDRILINTVDEWLQRRYQTIIPKKVIIRALQCFKEEHYDEYMKLTKEVTHEP